MDRGLINVIFPGENLVMTDFKNFVDFLFLTLRSGKNEIIRNITIMIKTLKKYVYIYSI